MNGTTPVLAVVAALTFGVGAAGEDLSVDERDVHAVVAEILARPDDADYGDPQRCIVSGRIDRTEVLSERLVVFHMRGGEKFAVQFKHRCPGLRRNGLTRFERRSMHICAHDTIQGLYGMAPDSGFWGPRCILPYFEPVTEEQIAFIEEAMQTRGSRRR